MVISRERITMSDTAPASLTQHAMLVVWGQYPHCLGLIDGIDHLGACVGALLAGTTLLPVLGITATCLLVGILNLATFLLMLTQK